MVFKGTFIANNRLLVGPWTFVGVRVQAMFLVFLHDIDKIRNSYSTLQHLNSHNYLLL